LPPAALEPPAPPLPDAPPTVEEAAFPPSAEVGWLDALWMMDTTPPPAFAPALDEVYGAGLLPPASEEGVAAPAWEWLADAEDPWTTLSAAGDEDLGAVVVAAGETGVCAGDAEVVYGVGVLGAVGVAAEDAGWRATGGLHERNMVSDWWGGGRLSGGLGRCTPRGHLGPADIPPIRDRAL